MDDTYKSEVVWCLVEREDFRALAHSSREPTVSPVVNRTVDFLRFLFRLLDNPDVSMEELLYVTDVAAFIGRNNTSL